MEEITPRVGGAQLGNFLGRNIQIICDTKQMRQNNTQQFVLHSTDGFDVLVSLPPGERFESEFVQIEGKITGRNEIDVRRMHPIHTQNFDINNYNKALELMHGKFQHLFQ